MSTLLRKMFSENFAQKFYLKSGEQVRCSLCRGELYPGDPYYLLEGQRVCEVCLERYAQHYFSHQRRRLGKSEKEVR